MQNFIGKLLEIMKKIDEGLKRGDLGLTAGQTFLVQQLTSQILRPGIEMLEQQNPSSMKPNLEMQISISSQMSC